MSSTILVVEDEPAILENIAETLTLEGYTVLRAVDGETGLEHALHYQPDLIVCDIMMPKVDGFGVLLRLRNDSRTSLTPFIFLTARADRPSMRRGMEMGADDFIPKPFVPDELLKAVETQLEKFKERSHDRDRKLDALRHSIAHAVPHELRTPLTGILGCAEFLMLDYETMERQRVYEIAELVMRSGRRLQSLVENYLLYSQLELVKTDKERMNAMRSTVLDYPDSLTSDIVQIITQKAERNADVTFTTVPGAIKIGHDNYERIIVELVENAMQFSEPGQSIEVTTSLTDDDYYRLTVTDHGRGMAQEDIASIGAYTQFHREFYEQQGLGLGLAIIRLLTDIHQGRFNVTSTLGEWTTVTIDLPIAE